MVPISEGLGDVGGQVIGGELGTGANPAMVMTEPQQCNICSLGLSVPHSRASGLQHFLTTSHHLTLNPAINL